MRNLRESWKLASLFAVGTILNAGYQLPAKAFTLIEIVYLPAVQLIAGQSADIKVTNVSANTINVVLTTYLDNGTMLKQEEKAIAPGATFTDEVKASASGPLSFHARVGSDTANAALADVMAFDKQTGQVIAILPAVGFDTK